MANDLTKSANLRCRLEGVIDTSSLVSVGLCEKTQEVDNEMGGIKATNCSSRGECLGAVFARIARERLGSTSLGESRLSRDQIPAYDMDRHRPGTKKLQKLVPGARIAPRVDTNSLYRWQLEGTPELRLVGSERGQASGTSRPSQGLPVLLQALWRRSARCPTRWGTPFPPAIDGPSQQQRR